MTTATISAGQDVAPRAVADSRHPIARTFQAVKVFVGAAFSIAVLGSYRSYEDDVPDDVRGDVRGDVCGDARGDVRRDVRGEAAAGRNRAA